VALIVAGDSVHNLVDGAAIAAAFLADPGLGLLTAVAVAAHELPQELADVGVLLSLGLAARRVLLVNALSALTAVVGAALVLALGDLVRPYLPALLALLCGGFLYLVWVLLRGLGRAAWPAGAVAFAGGLALFAALSRLVGAGAAH
jgi:zinc and cadmium transporter